MNKKLDVFKILEQTDNKNQEHENAPDFDFYNVKNILEQRDFGKNNIGNILELHDPVKMNDPVKQAAEPLYKDAAKTDSVKTVKTEPRIRIKLSAILKPVIAVLILVMIVLCALTVQKVAVDSMSPAISRGDMVAVNKLTNNYKKGDVIVFQVSGKKYIARIVAGKGDVVKLDKSGGLYINNKLQEEENIYTATLITDETVKYPVIVGEGEYFVLGDNRTDSVDSRSRQVGLLTEEDIVGKVIYCFKKIN